MRYMLMSEMTAAMKQMVRHQSPQVEMLQEESCKVSRDAQSIWNCPSTELQMCLRAMHRRRGRGSDYRVAHLIDGRFDRNRCHEHVQRLPQSVRLFEVDF